MRILLAKPLIEKSKRVHTVHPLSLGYLASALRREHDVAILDCEQLGYGADDFASFLSRHKPDMVGITVFSHNKALVTQSLSIIKGMLPDAKVVFGGPHVNAKGARVLQEFPGLDYAIRGEAERSLPLLAGTLEGGKLPGDPIPGLIFRDQGGQIHEIENRLDEDISQYDPMPYDLLHIKDYFGGVPQGFFYRHRELVSMITSRGCPYPCTFCAGSVSNGKKVRYRKVENVLQEIEQLAGEYGVKEIHILDDNFTFSNEYVTRFCQEIIQRGLRLDFALPNGIRLDKITDELLETMRRAGFYSISFGIESGSDDTLKRIKKLETTDFIRKQLALAKKHGFRLTGTFIIGFPWETEEDIENTLQFAKSLPLDHAAFGNFTPLPATELTAELIAKGELKEDYEVPYTWGAVTYSPAGIAPERLKKLQSRCVFSFYFPRRIHLVLANLRFSSLFHFIRRLWLLLKSNQ